MNKVLCEFELAKAGLCRCGRCKREVKHADPATLFASCKMGCSHLGEQIESTVKVQCGNKLKPAKAFACEVYGRCLPLFRPEGESLKTWHERKPESDLYHLCHRCPSYKAVERKNVAPVESGCDATG